MPAADRDAATRRTYADHVRDWEAARSSIAEARLSGEVDAVWLDAGEALLDATGFKDATSLRRQLEIVQRIGSGRV